MKKLLRYIANNLLLQVLIMIALGIAIGQFAPVWLVRIFVSFNEVFASILSFVVPLLILALVTAAIADTGKGAGKMLIWTLALAYVSTVLAGIFTYGVSDWVFPKLIETRVGEGQLTTSNEIASQLVPFVDIKFPPLMDVMSALLLSFILGLTILKYEMPIFKGAINELRNVIMHVLNRLVIPLLPLYIFGVFLKITVAGEIKMLTDVYLKVILVMLGLLAMVLLIQYSIAGIVTRRNPFRLLGKMFPALMTALASSSSAATLPVTLRCAESMGAKPNVVNFVIPMCANIHLSGAAVRTITLAVSTMIMFNVPYTLLQFIGFIFVFSVTVVAAPGIPGGVIMVILGMLEAMLGFNHEMLAIMVTLSIALDSIGTAVNVCGDGALMMIVDKIMGKEIAKPAQPAKPIQ